MAHTSHTSHSTPLLPIESRPAPAPYAARPLRHDAGGHVMPEALTRWAPPPMFQPLPTTVPMSAPLVNRFVLSADMPPTPESAPLLPHPVLLGPPPMGMPGLTTPVFPHGTQPFVAPAPTMTRPASSWLSSSPSLSASTVTSPSKFMPSATPTLHSSPHTSQSSIMKDESLGPFALDEDVKPPAAAAGPWLPPLPWL